MNELKNDKYAVISVMGPHAGESESIIFRRKIDDIERIGRTFWLIKSYQAKPAMVKNICKQAKTEERDVHCFFIEPSSRGGATPTKTSQSAEMCSEDRVSWVELPKALSPVTGKIDSSAYALVFDELKLERGILDLWSYANFLISQSHYRSGRVDRLYVQ